MKIVFNSVPPSKKNSRRIICRGKFPKVLPSEAYETWHTEQMWLLKKHKPKKPIERCEISCEFWFKDNRRHDLSNIFESIADTLVDAEILIDDTWQVVETVLLYGMGIDKSNPRVIVDIEELSTVCLAFVGHR